MEEIDFRSHKNAIVTLLKILDCTSGISESIRIIKSKETVTHFFSKNLELRLKAAMAWVKELQKEFGENQTDEGG